MREKQYQAYLIRKLPVWFPGCVILKIDPDYIQGIHDLFIFYQDRYAFIEVKVSSSSRVQPNQEYYVKMLNDMSFAAFIHPENEEEVLRDLQQAFGC